MAQVMFEPVSNRADWIDQVQLYDSNTNQPVDLTGASVVLAVVDPRSHLQMLLAQTADGSIVIPGSPAVGIFEFTFSAQQMRKFDAQRQYEVGCTVILPSGTVIQPFTGSVAVFDGLVP